MRLWCRQTLWNTKSFLYEMYIFLFLNLLVFSESGPGILRGHGVNCQPTAQVPGHQPGHARPQRPAVLLHPLCFPAAQQWSQLALSRYLVVKADSLFFLSFFGFSYSFPAFDLTSFILTHPHWMLSLFLPAIIFPFFKFFISFIFCCCPTPTSIFSPACSTQTPTHLKQVDIFHDCTS